jgi:hypothetical protein
MWSGWLLRPTGGLLWRVGVGLWLHWRVSVADEAVTPKKVWSDAHTPKKALPPGAAACLR